MALAGLVNSINNEFTNISLRKEGNNETRDLYCVSPSFFGLAGQPGLGSGSDCLSCQGPERGSNGKRQIPMLFLGQKPNRFRSHENAHHDIGATGQGKGVWGAGKTGVAGGATGAIVGGATKGKKGAVRGGLIGAAGGALIGGARSSNQRNREEQKRKDWERKETNNYVRARNEYNRAFGACMEGRGYSVK